jgi:inward rectifier potassium channel
LRNAEGFARVERLGHTASLRDIYAYLMRARWSTLLVLCALAYILLNLVFASLYLSFDGSIQGARPGVFLDAFSFSVQTLSTIGYGAMAPHGAGHIIVACEALTGIICLALATGLVFNKFARPTSRVLFSHGMIINERDGAPHLSFRLANARGNEIVEAMLRVTVLIDEVTQEGERMRRLHDLKLERARTPVFTMSWLVLHRIDEKSPLHGMSRKDIEQVRFVVSLTGLDTIFAQQVHARHMYFGTDIEFDRTFVDVMTPLEDGSLRIDLRRFHETKSLKSEQQRKKP